MRRKVAIWVVLIILLLTSGCGGSGQDARIEKLETQQENEPNSTKAFGGDNALEQEASQWAT